MNSIVLIILSAAIFFAGYLFYGKSITRLLGMEPERKTPAHDQHDAVDFVPARHWLVLFGHHFSSISGAGPIVGPVLAVAYWGWGPAVLWILIGSIFMGAVADYSSLVMSVRFSGQSVSEIAKTVMSKRARLFLSIFIWMALILVVAVFMILAAKTFVAQPAIVIPSIGIIPLACVIGWLLYAKKWPLLPVTLVGLAGLFFLLYGGSRVPVILSETPGVSLKIWMGILVIYCFVASVTPVQYLLQPRDYLCGFILFAAILFGFVGILVSHQPMNEAMFVEKLSADHAGGSPGPLWPMLFVTVACGAISGFHSVVSSGTTSKQLSSEKHALRIGFGGMLLEGFLAILVVCCVASVISHAELLDFVQIKSKGGPIAAFGKGFGILTSPFLGSFGAAFAIMALNAFILTTLDTATRITRYMTSELTGIQNRYLSTLVVVVIMALLAFSGQWQRIWILFGASNQLVAALALLVVSCWLISRNKPVKKTLLPALFMLVTSIGAFLLKLIGAFNTRNAAGDLSPQWFIVFSAALLIIFAVLVFAEGFRMIQNAPMRTGS